MKLAIVAGLIALFAVANAGDECASTGYVCDHEGNMSYMTEGEYYAIKHCHGMADVKECSYGGKTYSKSDSASQAVQSGKCEPHSYSDHGSCPSGFTSEYHCYCSESCIPANQAPSCKGGEGYQYSCEYKGATTIYHMDKYEVIKRCQSSGMNPCMYNGVAVEDSDYKTATEGTCTYGCYPYVPPTTNYPTQPSSPVYTPPTHVSPAYVPSPEYVPVTETSPVYPSPSPVYPSPSPVYPSPSPVYPSPSPVYPSPAAEPTPAPEPTPSPAASPTISAEDFPCLKGLDPHCKICHTNGCNQCKDNYFKLDYHTPCQACADIKYCTQCTDYTGCQQCKEGYTLQGEGQTLHTCVKSKDH